MIVTYNGESYTCTTAYKGADYVHLVDVAGVILASFDGVSDFSAFTISGGSWTTPCSTDDDKLAIVRQDGTVGHTEHTYNEIIRRPIVLSDATKELFAPDSPANADAAFALLARFNGGLGNEYVWEKLAGQTVIGQDGVGQCFTATSNATWESITQTLYPTCSLSSDGLLVLSGTPVTLTGSQAYPPTVPSEYVGYYGRGKTISAPTGSDVVFRLTTTSVSQQQMSISGNTKYTWAFQNAAIIVPTTVYSHVSYVNSQSPTAYPPAVSDGYTYTALGQLCESPAMEVGIEYRTKEFYMGKPVYTKLINFGTMPSNSQKIVAHGASDVDYVIDVYGHNSSYNSLTTLDDVISVFANRTSVYIATSANLSARSAYVAMKYTKTTD